MKVRKVNDGDKHAGISETHKISNIRIAATVNFYGIDIVSFFYLRIFVHTSVFFSTYLLAISHGNGGKCSTHFYIFSFFYYFLCCFHFVIYFYLTIKLEI